MIMTKSSLHEEWTAYAPSVTLVRSSGMPNNRTNTFVMLQAEYYWKSTLVSKQTAVINTWPNKKPPHVRSKAKRTKSSWASMWGNAAGNRLVWRQAAEEEASFQRIQKAIAFCVLSSTSNYLLQWSDGNLRLYLLRKRQNIKVDEVSVIRQ